MIFYRTCPYQEDTMSAIRFELIFSRGPRTTRLNILELPLIIPENGYSMM